MIANYHTHTYRCHHASGTEKEYIEKAIEKGLKVLGFSDHTPYTFPPKHSQYMRMDMGQLDDYVDTILKLKKEYEKDITIHLGLEVEYYPDYFDSLCQKLSDYPLEYLLLAQHHLGNSSKTDFYSGDETDSEEHLIQYCKQVTEAMNHKIFTYLAHPDLIYYIGSASIYDKHMRQLCQHAKEMGLPLELNFTGIAEKRQYPLDYFWKIAGEVGNEVVFGLDAHKLSLFDYEDTLAYARNLVDRYNLQVIDQVKLIKPF